MPSDAVIFVPGIKGTKLVNTNRVSFDTIWSGVQSNFETIEDLELTTAHKSQYYDEDINTIIEPGEIEELAYAEFIRDLNPGKPVFIYNYDWRLSAEENAYRLADFVDYIKQKSTASKQSKALKRFDFITHSLGNFIVRAYLQQFDFTDINKVVFTVPPFQGSIEIASVAVVGQGLFDNVKAKMRKLIRTMPGALELLPHYQYASQFKDSTGKHNFFNINHWQSNITKPKDKNAQNLKQKKQLAEKFEQTLKVAKATVNNKLLDLSELETKERNKCIVIARTGYETWQSVNIIKEPEAPNPKNYIDFEHGLRNKCGDGSVADASSCCYHDKIKTFVVEDAFFFRDYGHGFILKDERVQRIIRRFLSGQTGKFWEIPGNSVKRVEGFEELKDEETELKYRKVET